MLEEDRVAELLVVAGHAETDGDLEARPRSRGRSARRWRRRARPRPARPGPRWRWGAAPTAGGCRRSRASARGRRWRRRPGRRSPGCGYADDGGLRVPALVQDVADRRGAGRQPVRGDAEAEHVEGPLPDRGDHLGGDAVGRRVDREGRRAAGRGSARRGLAGRVARGFGGRSCADHRERADGGAGGAEERQRATGRRGTRGSPSRGQLLEVHRLDDVDAALDQQHAVGGQQPVAGAGREPLERDGVGADGVDVVVGEPGRAGLARRRARRCSGRGRCRRRRCRSAGPSRCGPAPRRRRRSRCPGARQRGLEVGDGDLLAGLEPVDAEGCRARRAARRGAPSARSCARRARRTGRPRAPRRRPGRRTACRPGRRARARRRGCRRGCPSRSCRWRPSRRRRAPCRRGGGGARASTPGGWATAACRRSAAGRGRRLAGRSGRRRAAGRCSGRPGWSCSWVSRPWGRGSADDVALAKCSGRRRRCRARRGRRRCRRRWRGR